MLVLTAVVSLAGGAAAGAHIELLGTGRTYCGEVTVADTPNGGWARRCGAAT